MAPFTKTGSWQAGLFAYITFGFFAPAHAANESLITSPDWPVYQWFASTDPKNENEDYLLLKPNEKRRIPLTAGILNRLWFTALEPDKVDVSLVLPGKPAYKVTRGGQVVNKSWPSSRALIYEKAFTAYHSQSIELGGVSTPWQILPQGATLEVINRSQNAEGNKFFYQASIRPAFKAPAIRQSPTQTLSAEVSLASGEEHNQALPDSGIIQTITISPLKVEECRTLQLRVTPDGVPRPAVDAPLAALLGLFQNGQQVSSNAFAFEGSKATFSWPMPFSTAARVTFVNHGENPLKFNAQIAYQKLDQAPPYRFHAAYGSARTVEKKPLRMLDIKGKGAFVGMNLSIMPAPDSARRTFAYLEGNETITADGKKYEGTGTEDFFSSAWYFPEKPFSSPYHGMTAKNKLPPSVSAYRLMIPDALPFKQSLQFDFEHGNGNNSNDLLFRWVAFWYQAPGGQFEVKDALQENGNGDNAGGPAHGNIFLLALITALIVGGGGGLIIKLIRNRSEKAS